MSQRFASASSSITSHFNMAHTTKAVNSDDMPYTSPSTAENQAESENVQANAPTMPAPINTQILSIVSSSGLLTFMSLRPKSVIDQNRKSIVNALASTLLKFIQ